MKKQKKFGRKLALNKQTIAMLDEQSTKKVFAGATLPNPACTYECTLDCTIETVCTCFTHCAPCTEKGMWCECMYPRTY